jgi:hypothetical protein
MVPSREILSIRSVSNRRIDFGKILDHAVSKHYVWLEIDITGYLEQQSSKKKFLK